MNLFLTYILVLTIMISQVKSDWSTSNTQIEFLEQHFEVDTSDSLVYSPVDVLVGSISYAIYYLYTGSDDHSYITKTDTDGTEQYTMIAEELWQPGTGYITTTESKIFVIAIYTIRAYVVCIDPATGESLKYMFSSDYNTDTSERTYGSMDISNTAYFFTSLKPSVTLIKYDTQVSSNNAYVEITDSTGDGIQSLAAITDDKVYFHFLSNTDNKITYLMIYDFGTGAIDTQLTMTCGAACSLKDSASIVTLTQDIVITCISSDDLTVILQIDVGSQSVISEKIITDSTQTEVTVEDCFIDTSNVYFLTTKVDDNFGCAIIKAGISDPSDYQIYNCAESIVMTKGSINFATNQSTYFSGLDENGLMVFLSLETTDLELYPSISKSSITLEDIAGEFTFGTGALDNSDYTKVTLTLYDSDRELVAATLLFDDDLKLDIDINVWEQNITDNFKPNLLNQTIDIDYTWYSGDEESTQLSVVNYLLITKPSWVTVSNAGIITLDTPNISTDTTYTFVVRASFVGTTYTVDRIVTIYIIVPTSSGSSGSGSSGSGSGTGSGNSTNGGDTNNGSTTESNQGSSKGVGGCSSFKMSSDCMGIVFAIVAVIAIAALGCCIWFSVKAAKSIKNGRKSEKVRSDPVHHITSEFNGNSTHRQII